MHDHAVEVNILPIILSQLLALHCFSRQAKVSTIGVFGRLVDLLVNFNVTN